MGFIINNGLLEKYIDEGKTEVVIPNEVTSIGDYASLNTQPCK